MTEKQSKVLLKTLGWTMHMNRIMELFNEEVDPKKRIEYLEDIKELSDQGIELYKELI